MQHNNGNKIVKVKKFVTEQLSKHVLYNLQNKALTRGCPFKFERGKALTREVRDKNFTNRFGFFVLLCFFFFFFFFIISV